MSSSRLRFRVLGPLTVLADGEPLPVSGPKQRALLALLLLNANRVIPRERLLAELFVELSPESADHALRNQLSRLRKVLVAAGAEPARLVTRPPGYLLRVEPDELDLDDFEQLLADGREALAAGDPSTAARSLRAAEALWSGRALADLDLEGLVRIEIERLEELRLAAVEERIDAELALGRQRELVSELEALSEEHPYRERFRAQLMLALYRSGRQAEGLEVYRRTRRLFDDELGLVPGVELQELERAILVQDPALRPPSPEGIQSGRPPLEGLACPYKGLAPFEPDDTELFFGRERLVEELTARLEGSLVLLLTGPSGSGKSSLLRAGLLPQLEGHKVVIRPGMRPVTELARAVGGDLEAALGALPPGERVVIAVDQLEEVFAADVNEDERTLFFTALVEAAWDPQRRALILLAMRGDFADRLARYPELADLVAPNQTPVGPMSAAELRRAIEGPASRTGLAVEPALVDALVHEVLGEPGGLPLLSAALVDLWRDRSDSSLTLSAYERTGGIRGAVARHAEAALRSLDADEQPVARRIVLRLVAGGDGDPLTRRRVRRDELEAGDEAVEPVLSVLVERRLLVADADSVELVHDALLRQWPKLTEWLEEEADRRRLHRHLGETAAAWDAGGRDRGELYRGARLAAATEWATGPDASPTPLEGEFLEESRLAFVRENDRQRRTTRRLRGLLAAALVLLAGVAAVGAIAFVERASAQQRATAADAERLGAQALVEPRLDTSLLLAREGVNLDNSSATRSNLLSALLRSPAAIAVASNPGARILDDAISPSGRLLAYRTDNGAVAFVDARTLHRVGRSFADPSGNQLENFGSIARPDRALAFSPDGRTLAVGSTDGNSAELYLVDARTRRVRSSLYQPIGAATVDVLFSASGRTLISGEIVSGQSPGPPAEIIVKRNPVDLLAGAHSGPLPAGRLIGFVDHGRELLVTTGEKNSVLLNARTLDRVRELPGLGGAAAVSTSGERAAFGRNDGSIVLLDLRTDATTTMRGHASAPISSLAFNPAGTTLVSTAKDGSVAAWDVATLSLQQTFTGHSAEAEGPVFSPDGSTLYAGGDDGDLIAWDAGGTRRLGRPFRFFPRASAGEGTQPPESLPWTATAVSPDSTLFATSPGPGRITLWRARSETVIDELSGPVGSVKSIAFSHHGHLLAAAGDGAKLAIWTLANPTRVRLLPQPAGFGVATFAIAFSPNDRLLATADGNGRIDIYNLRTGHSSQAALAQGALQALDFSPDGRFVAAAGLAGQITVVDLRHNTVKTMSLGNGTDDIFALRFSPEGDAIATGDIHGVVDFWNAKTGHRLPQQLAGPGGSISSLSFDPTGSRLMTISNDGGIRLWDLTTDKPIGTPLPGATSSGWGTFFPDGRQVVAVFGNGTGVLWNVDPTAWNSQACQVANRNLTHAEWRTYLPNLPYHKVCP